MKVKLNWTLNNPEAYGWQSGRDAQFSVLCGRSLSKLPIRLGVAEWQRL